MRWRDDAAMAPGSATRDRVGPERIHPERALWPMRLTEAVRQVYERACSERRIQLIGEHALPSNLSRHGYRFLLTDRATSVSYEGRPTAACPPSWLMGWVPSTEPVRVSTQRVSYRPLGNVSSMLPDALPNT